MRNILNIFLAVLRLNLSQPPSFPSSVALGVPVTFPELSALTGDVGGRAIFSRHRVTWLPWLDASLALDVDTLEDYTRLLNYEDG